MHAQFDERCGSCNVRTKMPRQVGCLKLQSASPSSASSVEQLAGTVSRFLLPASLSFEWTMGYIY